MPLEHLPLSTRIKVVSLAAALSMPLSPEEDNVSEVDRGGSSLPGQLRRNVGSRIFALVLPALAALGCQDYRYRTKDASKVALSEPKRDDKEALRAGGGGDFYVAAYAAERAGDKERARELWGKRSAQFEAKGDFYGAAYAAERAGDQKRARKLFRKAADQ